MLGGFLNAVMLSAARKYIELEFDDKNLPDPVHVFVQFLRTVPPGAVRIACHSLRVSSRQCVVRVEPYRHDNTEPSSPGSNSSSTVATVTYGNYSKEKGLTQDAKSAVPLSPANRETDCVRIDDPVVDATLVTHKLHWIAPRSANGLWGHRLGGHQREVWLSFRDGSKIDSSFHLALLADMVSPKSPAAYLPNRTWILVTNQPLQPPATHEHGFYTRYALSTLCLSVEFKKRPDPTTQRVMIRSNSNVVSNGRYDVNLQILDQAGDILALSNHVLYISSLRPESL